MASTCVLTHTWMMVEFRTVPTMAAYFLPRELSNRFDNSRAPDLINLSISFDKYEGLKVNIISSTTQEVQIGQVGKLDAKQMVSPVLERVAEWIMAERCDFFNWRPCQFYVRLAFILRP